MLPTPAAAMRSRWGDSKGRTGALLAYANWNSARALIVGVFLARLVYLIALCPYELVGDEGYYWEQARHLDWCYNEKGPALPWMIAACCRVLGDHEWAVRLPVAISSLLAGWGIGRLAMAVSDDDERVGFLAVLIFCLLPAFQANAQLCTQDGPLIAIWVALTAIGLRLARRWSGARESRWGDWMLFWFVLGVGFLLKQSILLFLPGMAIYWFFDKKAAVPKGRWWLQQLIGVLLFTVVISPMIYWNARHGWPMFAHTLGHLGAGGDQVGDTIKGNPLTWLGGTLGGIVGAFGPAFVILCLWASLRARREIDPERWRDRLWLICAAWPSIGFFIALSFIKPVVPSWPLPHFVPLVALVATLAVELPRRLNGKETWFGRAWGVMIWYGVIGWLVLSFPTGLAYLPKYGAKLQKSVLSRFTGHRAEARELEDVLARVNTPDGRPPIIVTKYYMPACLYAFYVPSHPTTTTAQRYLGRREMTFDIWPDTNLANPALRGRTLLLVGEDVPWERALRYERLEPIPGERRFNLAIGYQGPR